MLSLPERLAIPNVFDSVDQMFLTVIIVVVVTALFYRLMGRYNKPMVFGGLIAGWLLANLHLPKAYFDLDSCSNLGDIGIILFIMLQGTRFEYATILKRKTNLIIPFFSVATTFCGGIVLAHYIYPLNKQAAVSLTLSEFSFLIGLACSIAAFSLVSLFIAHTNLLSRRIAHVALLSAASDDVIFWLLFAGILLYFQTNLIIRVDEILLMILYLLTLIFVFPRLIHMIVAKITSTRAMLGFMIGGCFVSAILADAVNLHQIFGSFIFGLLLPRDNPHIAEIRVRMEDLVNVVLLPIFFAQIGSIANIAIIKEFNMVLIGILFSLIIFMTKAGGVYFSSRFLNYKPQEAVFLAGVLNFRGIVEVVTLKVAWGIGLITIQVMTVLIIMCLITNLIATYIAFLTKNNLPDLSRSS